MTKLLHKGKVAQLLQKVKAAELLTRTAKDQKTVSSVMPDNSLQSQAQTVFEKEFSKSIAGPFDLQVTDGAVLRIIGEHAHEIDGLAFFLSYVTHILKVSAGQINRPQWHSRGSIVEIMKMSGNNLSRYERKWIADGWLMVKTDNGKGAFRILGNRFNNVRLTCIQIESSTQIQIESSTCIQNESRTQIQIESTNQTILIKQNEPNEPNVVVLEEQATTTHVNELKWLSKKMPWNFINSLKAAQKLPRDKRGWIDDLDGWNQIAKELWTGKTDKQINNELQKLKNHPGTLPNNLHKLRLIIEPKNEPEPNLELKPAFESQEAFDAWKATVKDDMPF